MDVRFIPISALLGDNVVERSQHMPWYDGQTLLSVLETTHISSDLNLTDTRFPVQYVIRPQSTEYHDYRGYAGRIAGGVFRQGDAVKVLPSGFASRIKSLDTYEAESRGGVRADVGHDDAGRRDRHQPGRHDRGRKRVPAGVAGHRDDGLLDGREETGA